jgi:MFS family permease
MQINNTQFGILLSSVTLVNTMLPLFAGVLIDDISSLGSIRATTLVSCVIFLGSLLVSIGGTYDSYACMMTGQVVYGLGGGMIVTMQEGILSRWFRDKEVAIVIGIMLCTARLTKWVAKMITYPILNSTGSHAWPIHVATIFCAAGAVMNSLYWIVMWRKGLATVSGKEKVQYQGSYTNDFERQQHQDISKEEKSQQQDNSTAAAAENSSTLNYESSIISSFQQYQQKRSFKWSYSILLYLPKTFWMIPLIQLTMSSVLSSFDDIAT